MSSNIEKVMARGESLDLLKDKSDDLAAHSDRFKRSSTKLKHSMYCADVKTTMTIIAGVLVIPYHRCTALTKQGRSSATLPKSQFYGLYRLCVY
jgi:hypothetical protein